jgi:cob(I)alamin adenosyltransferase
VKAPAARTPRSTKPGDFREPRVGLSKIYTRTGDKGETSLVGGQRVPKDDVRIEAYGTVDELNAWVGLARAAAIDSGAPGVALAKTLLRVQHQLFNLGSILSTLPKDLGTKQARVTDADIAWLEGEMDELTATLPPLRSFVLPGGSRLNALLHLARTVCRRCERVVVALRREGGCGDLEVRYLNRLSDALFVWSRDAARATGLGEVLWDPNQG